MYKPIFFICKKGRLRDLPLLRVGANALGFNFHSLVLPFCYPILPLIILLSFLGIPVRVIVSDTFLGDAIFSRFLGGKAARMLWNYADEFPVCLKTEPFNRVSFFDEDIPQVKKFIFAPQFSFRSHCGVPSSSVIFVGDVDMSCHLPGGFDWWWNYMQELLEVDGYGFYLESSYDRALMQRLNVVNQKRSAKVFAKNFLRLKIVQAARTHFDKNIVLIGSNWRRYGLDSLPSIYSLKGRLDLYATSGIHLDCGSKSGDNALYPRSSEIISFAGAPLQVVCADSDSIYGGTKKEIVFSSEDSLCKLLEERLTESPAHRMERTEKLTSHLIAKNLTMADSLRTLFL